MQRHITPEKEETKPEQIELEVTIPIILEVKDHIGKLILYTINAKHTFHLNEIQSIGNIKETIFNLPGDETQ